jgi:phosphoribosylformylglycinamidine synthase
MDLKQAGNLIYQVGLTRAELGGSHWCLVRGWQGGQVPTVNTSVARETFAAIHAAIRGGWVRACHDLSEGGLAVAAAEMCFAGGLGAALQLDAVAHDLGTGTDASRDVCLLFSESNSRFLCEVSPEAKQAFEQTLQGVPWAAIGRVTAEPNLEIRGTGAGDGQQPVVRAAIPELKQAWQKPLDW